MTDPTTPDLLPCRLCRSGFLNEFVYFKNRPDPTRVDMVQCLDCKCEATLSAWNTRPAPAILVNPLEWVISDDRKSWAASTIFGVYRVWDIDGGYLSKPDDRWGFRVAEDLSGAQKVALSEHQSLVRSAMQSTAAPQNLDERMKAAGMLTLTQMLAEPIMGKFGTHAGQWLDSKRMEYQKMRMQYELGDKSKDDDLWEWFFLHTPRPLQRSSTISVQLVVSTPHRLPPHMRWKSGHGKLGISVNQQASRGLLNRSISQMKLRGSG
ncbi:MAG: hypothetical protein HRU33_22250 [Rhodobacteraceae bacterium]|nr:hypothetical protein [Paracoccaceae bacterium]